MIKHNPANRRKNGFTIVELLMAMSFVSILLIAITVLIMNIQGLYRRGIAIREVNAVSRSIVDDLTRAIANAPAAVETAHAVEFVRPDNRVEGGVFCTGFYSYIWRQAEYLRDAGTVRVNGKNDYRLLKASDVGRNLCRFDDVGLAACSDDRGKLRCSLTGMLPDLAAADPIELISGGGLELALFDFRIFPPAKSNITGHVFYSGSFILGTPRGANAAGGIVSAEVCVPPGAADMFDFQYCSINKFNFAASSLGAIGEK